VKKYGSVRQATNDNTVWRMGFACWHTEATDTHVECVILVCFLLGNSPASEFYMPCNRTHSYPVTLLPIGSGYFRAKPSPVWIPQLFSNLVIHLLAYEDGTECSETSAYKIQTPCNYQEENIQHTGHGKSLKSRMCHTYCFSTTTVGMRTRLIVTCVCVCVCACPLPILFILNLECKLQVLVESEL
jgi:hypothetical protein